MTHGFLILAHKETDALYYFIETILSDTRARVYLHLDSKCPDETLLLHYVSNKRVTIMPRHNLAWAHQSIIYQELRMIETAYLDGCDFFWICSGDDGFCQPIVGCLDFVETHGDKNFIAVRPFLPHRLFYYNLGVRKQGRQFPKGWQRKFLLWQMKNFKIRKIPYQKFAMGSQWCTINRTFAKFLINEGKTWRFRKTFFASYMADEVFIPLLARTFGFPLFSTKPQYETLKNNFRLVDFSESDVETNAPPKTFGFAEQDKVLSSGAWIVRKVDDELARVLYYLNRKEECR